MVFLTGSASGKFASTSQRHYPVLVLGSDMSSVSMVFLCSFLKGHMAVKPVLASQNVSCFVRLGYKPLIKRFLVFLKITLKRCPFFLEFDISSRVTKGLIQPTL